MNVITAIAIFDVCILRLLSGVFHINIYSCVGV